MGSEMRKWVKEPAAHHDMKLKFHWPVMMADRINPPMANKIRTKIRKTYIVDSTCSSMTNEF